MKTMTSPSLLGDNEQKLRLTKIAGYMRSQGIKAALVSSSANLYYITGRVISGYVYITSDNTEPIYLVKRPNDIVGDRVHNIRKPEEIKAVLAGYGIDCSDIALELNRLTYSSAMRLAKALDIAQPQDAGTALSLARASKTSTELDMLRESAMRHSSVYRRIPQLYQPGMTDLELQIEIERLSRLEGCLGQFRIAGDDMELFMGNILAGDNADSPAPFDFAMGGAGVNPALPIGADGTIIQPGMSVMVDMNGNFTGYMTDMTRCYTLGHISQKAIDAHALSIDICHTLQQMGTVGAEAKALYDKAHQMACDAGFADYFMGHRQHAGFVGHGIGIEVNELPVLAPRSKSILEAGNVIAIEPKFVIPSTGAVGIENTYVVSENGPMECLTKCDEQLIKLD